MDASRIRFGPFEADLAARELFRDGQRVSLQEQPFLFLAALLERPGELVTREELRQRLWGDGTFVEHDIGLNKAGTKLRDALGDDAASPRYIETLPKRGYRFIGSIDQPALAPLPGRGIAVAPPAVEAGALAGRPARPASRLRTRLAVVAAVAVLLIATVAFVQRKTTRPHRRVVVAVLPLKSLDHNPDAAYLGDGITIDLINLLGRIHPDQIGVIAPTSAMTFRDAAQPVSAIAKQLGADYVVEGSIRRAGDQVRITAQLTRGDDQTQLWADSFDRPANTIQSDVIRAIANAVQVEVLPQQMVALDKPPTVSGAAYDEYLKGVYLQRMRGDAQNGMLHFERAIELDPNFAAAYAGLANCYSHLAPRQTYMPRAVIAAERSTQLDPSLGTGHATLASIRMTWQWDWKGAEREFQRALEHAPDDPDALMLYAQYLAAIGRNAEALKAMKHAEQLDPRSPLILQNLGRIYRFARQYDQAIFEYERSLRLDPEFYWGHLFLAFAYEERGDYANWLLHIQHAAQAKGKAEVARQLGEYAKAMGLPAMHDEYNRRVAAAVNYDTADTFTPVHSLMRLGRYDDALAMMERLMPNRPRDAVYLRVEPSFDVVRQDPRFKALVKGIGIP